MSSRRTGKQAHPLFVDKFEVFSSILKAAIVQTSRPEISEAITFWMDEKELKGYLRHLVRAHLLWFDPVCGAYKTSRRGELFLGLKAQLEDAIGSDPEEKAKSVLW